MWRKKELEKIQQNLHRQQKTNLRQRWLQSFLSTYLLLVVPSREVKSKTITWTPCLQNNTSALMLKAWHFWLYELLFLKQFQVWGRKQLSGRVLHSTTWKKSPHCCTLDLFLILATINIMMSIPAVRSLFTWTFASLKWKQSSNSQAMHFRFFLLFYITEVPSK